MSVEDLQSAVGSKLVAEKIEPSTGKSPRVRSKGQRPRKAVPESLPIELEVSAGVTQEALEVLADNDLAYAQWLRIVLLRLFTKTPALSRLKEKVDYNLSRTCEFLGFQNFEKYVEGRSLLQIRTELGIVLDAWEAELGAGTRFPRALHINLQALAEIVGLNELEVEILGLGVLIHSESTLEIGTSLLGVNLTGYNVERILAPLLGRKPEAVAQCLQRSAKLASSGLLSIDVSQHYGLVSLLDLMTPAFASRMLVLQSDIRKVVEGFVRPLPPNDLKPEDFPQIESNFEICVSLLKHALAQRTAGINILIYGKPGTGKTEFARMLAGCLKSPLMEICPTNLAGAPVPPIRRVRNYSIAQAFFRHAPAIILFDECEEVLVQPHQPHEVGEDGPHPRKSYINKVLETNAEPTIWIANSVQGFDEAYLRRFSLCFEMPLPTHEQRRKLLHKAFNGSIGQEAQAAMAQHKEATPALVMQTAKVLAAIAGGHDEAQRDTLALHVINNTLRAQSLTEVPAGTFTGLGKQEFEPTWVNSDVDLRQLCESLDFTRSGRLCVYGPPGTGKTAFGQWLARSLDVPHLVFKASELLSPYIGETEQNMARAFESARLQKALLQFDEVDSFLQDRQKASKQWEVTQVNEMLTQMDSYGGIFIASTNLFDQLDEASLRRFDMAIKFDFLKAESAWAMFIKTCEILGMPDVQSVAQCEVAAMTNLTPGDFEQVLRRSRLLRPSSARQVMRSLQSAVALKKASAPRPIGFLVEQTQVA